MKRAALLTRSDSWLENILREGNPIAKARHSLGVIGDVNYKLNIVLGNALKPAPGNVIYLKGVDIMCVSNSPSGGVKMTLRIGRSSDAITPLTNREYEYRAYFNTLTPTKYIPVGLILHELETVSALVEPWIDPVDDTGATTISFDLLPVGVEITNDLNFSAKSKILGIGDSILYGLGATLGSNMYGFLATDYFNNNGGDVRFINKSWEGATSSDFVKLANRGYYNVTDPDLILFNLGVNDIATGFEVYKQTLFRSNIDFAMKFFKKKWPDAKVIFMPGSPMQSEVKNQNLQLCKAILNDAKIASGNNNFYIADLSAAFPFADQSYYLSTDPAGDKKHPVDKGNIALGEALIQFISANNITI